MFSNALRSSLIALVSTAVMANAAALLSLRISGPDSVNTISDLNVAATLTNTGDETVNVLHHPHSALSTLPGDIFSIYHAESGTEPAFSGVLAKYVPKVAAAKGAYTTLSPGQSVTVQHNLADAYNFAAPGEGVYNIKARNPVFQIVNHDSSISSIRATQLPAHTAKISSQVVRTTTKRRTLVRRQSDDSDTCTKEHFDVIRDAIFSAEQYISEANNYMTDLQTSADPSERYTTWFGEYNSTRVDIVANHFNLLNQTDLKEFTYDCATCNGSDVYAYVYREQYGTIYLCPLFWESSQTGTDSQAGTLVHEASHFNENGGTQDYAYGQTNCTDLARDYPDYAVMNADSHEFFVENTPELD